MHAREREEAWTYHTMIQKKKGEDSNIPTGPINPPFPAEEEREV